MTREWYTPSDADQLRMEVELLDYEVRYLRSRVRELERANRRLERLKKAPPANIEDLQKAQSDLKWLLGRMNKPPIGFVFRMRAGFRTLTKRWLQQ